MFKKLIILSLLVQSKVIAQPIITDSLQSLDLQEVTIVGNKSKSIPGSGQYINGIQLEKLNQTNINNVLRTVPGVVIRDEEGFGLRPNIGLRGTSVNRSSKITIMEDGVLVAPAPYADPAAYYFPTFARLQGVEVLKGSSQIKYGPYTIGGALNLLSTATPNQFKGFAQVSFGSFNTNQQKVWVGDSRKHIDYIVEINRMASNGFKQLDNKANTGFERNDVMAKLRWHLAPNSKMVNNITLKFVHSSEEANETYLGLTFNDYKLNHLKRYAGTQKDLLNLNHQLFTIHHLISPIKNVVINTTVYTTKTFRNWSRASAFGGQSIQNILNNPTANSAAYNIMVGRANGSVEYQGAERSFTTSGIQSNIKYVFNTNAFSHKLELGVRLHKDNADRIVTRSTYQMQSGIMSLTASGVSANQENQIRNANSVASYLAYEVKYKNLTLSTGVRHEQIHLDIQNFGNNDNVRIGHSLKEGSSNISILLPGVGLSYNYNDFTTVFVGVHKGFSPPGMPSTTPLAAQARAETSVSYEVGYKYQKKSVSAQVTAFANNYHNILGSDNISGGGAGTGDLFNAGRAMIKGLEVALQLNLLKSTNENALAVPLNITYTYTSATFSETFVNGGGDWGSGKINKGDFIPFITPHLLSGSIGVENSKFNVTLLAMYNGVTSVKPNQGNLITPTSTEELPNVNALPGFLMLDFSSNYTLNKHFALFSSINNITNNKAIVANLPQGYRPNMPTNFRLGVKVNL